MEGKIVSLAKPLQTEYIYIAISKKSRFAKYLPEIDKAILKMRKNGTIDKLIEKHIELASKLNPSE